MRIIDSQVHIWAAERPDRPWRKGARPHLPEPLGYATLLAWMDAAGVDGAILVPPPFEGDRNDLSLEAAQAHPDRFAVMGKIALEDRASAALLPGWKQTPGMLGIRLNFLQDAAKRLITEGGADWFWPAAERHQIPLMILAPGLIGAFDRIAAQHPGLRIIIDHMGCDREDVDDAVAAKVAQVVALAKYPNVYVKVSAAPCLSSEPPPFRNIHPAIRRAIDAFGPQRAIWGTDLTRFIERCSYRDAIAMFTEHMEFLSAADQEWIMGRTLATCLGWSPRRTD